MGQGGAACVFWRINNFETSQFVVIVLYNDTMVNKLGSLELIFDSLPAVSQTLQWGPVCTGIISSTGLHVFSSNAVTGQGLIFLNRLSWSVFCPPAAKIGNLIFLPLVPHQFQPIYYYWLCWPCL